MLAHAHGEHRSPVLAPGGAPIPNIGGSKTNIELGNLRGERQRNVSRQRPSRGHLHAATLVERSRGLTEAIGELPGLGAASPSPRAGRAQTSGDAHTP